ncbi:MAG TPA: hypothetical protein EYP53_01895 [Candidatus Latescibacteria bacterium]|nr:hypothetical protein [Candidatus Latescibacterota bacterium]
MTGLERMMTALRREEPDRVPIWELIIDQPVIQGLYGDISYEDFVEKEELDGLTIFEDQRLEWIDGETYRDEWGIIWRVEPNGIAYPSAGPIADEGDLKGYQPPDPDADYRLETLEKTVKRFKGEKCIVFLGHETFEFSHYLLGGMDKLFLNYILNPQFVQELSEMIWSYKGRVLERAAELGADVLLTGDDYATAKGTLMSPAHFKAFVLPYLTKAVEVAHRRSLPFIKHTDGNLWKVMDLIVGAGIDALDPIEPLAGMDIGRVKDGYGDRIALAGNVDCSLLLPHGSEDQVMEAVKETLAKASVGGGHILASSNSIHPGVKPENYRAMVEAAKTFGEYPLDPEMVEAYRRKDYMAALLGRSPSQNTVESG